MLHRTREFSSSPIGQASAETASPVASKPEGHGQYALHVIDYTSWKALAHLRSIGACGRNYRRKHTDAEADYHMFSIENGDGSIY